MLILPVILSACFWFQPTPSESSLIATVRDERIFTISGEKTVKLSAIRQNGQFRGFSVKGASYP